MRDLHAERPMTSVSPRLPILCTPVHSGTNIIFHPSLVLPTAIHIRLDSALRKLTCTTVILLCSFSLCPSSLRTATASSLSSSCRHTHIQYSPLSIFLSFPLYLDISVNNTSYSPQGTPKRLCCVILHKSTNPSFIYIEWKYRCVW